jgi:hypothetical protein
MAVKRGVMNNNLHIAMATGAERPWWYVRFGLLATLAALVAFLVTLLSRPEMLGLADL